MAPAMRCFGRKVDVACAPARKALSTRRVQRRVAVAAGPMEQGVYSLADDVLTDMMRDLNTRAEDIDAAAANQPSASSTFTLPKIELRGFTSNLPGSDTVAGDGAPVPPSAPPASAAPVADAPALVEQTPEVPAFELPEAPSKPSFELPEMPAFELPELPFQLPNLGMFGKLEASDVEDTVEDTPLPSMQADTLPPPATPETVNIPQSLEAAPGPADADMLQDSLSAAGNMDAQPTMPSNPIMGLTDTVDAASKAVNEAVSGTVDAAGKVVNEALGDSLKGVTGALDSIGSGVQGTLEAVSSEVAISREIITQNFESLVPKQTMLPPELQNQLDSVVGVATSLKATFDEAPLGYSIIGLLLVGVPSYLAFQAEFAGFEGCYGPEALAEALQTENNILVADVRQLAELSERGVLDLRRAARGKAANVPAQEVRSDIVPLIKNKRDLANEITAALVCGLTPVNSFTKIIIMDANGSSQAKVITRAVTSAGYRGFLATGGFAAWQAAGLDIKQTASYDVTAADMLSDKTEELAEVAEMTLDRAAATLSVPQNAAIATTALVTLISALVRPHETFQFLGVLGIEISTITYLLQFDSPAAAVAGISESVGSVVSAFPPLPPLPSSLEAPSAPSRRTQSAPSPKAAPPRPVPVPESSAPKKESEQVGAD